jgi:homoserine kinase type II
MSPISAQTLETLGAVLDRFGVTDAPIRDIRSGRVNKHWRVETSAETYVLRRYNERRSAAAIQYEHEVLRHLAGKGWPVATALPAGGRSATAVEIGGRHYAFFRLLPGRPAPYTSPRYARLKGRLLARLHQDMATWEPPGQRDGFGRVWELDVYVGVQSRFDTFNELLMAFGQTYTDLARVIRSQKYAMLRELSQLGYGELPPVPGHFDFHHDNLLFLRGELTGLLDLDFVHLDARVADIAESIVLGCLAPPAYNEIDPVAVRAFVGGYTEHTPLSDDELQLIVPLVRAAILSMAQWRLSQWAEGERGDEPLRSIQRSVFARFPSFVRQRDELEAAVLQAAATVHGR